MPGSGTSWRAEDLREWSTARVVVTRGLNTLDKTCETILAELREADRKAAAEEVRRQRAEQDLAALTEEVRKLRHRVAQVEQVQQAAVEAEERQDRAEARTLRRRVLGLLGVAGGGGGLALLGERLLSMLG